MKKKSLAYKAAIIIVTMKIESAKLFTLCAHMLTCQRTLRHLCAYVVTCIACFHVHVLTYLTCLHAITSNNKNKFSITFFVFFLWNKTAYENWTSNRNVSTYIYFENSEVHSCISLTRRMLLRGAYNSRHLQLIG